MQSNKIYSRHVEDEAIINFNYGDFKGIVETSWSKEGYRNLTTNIKIYFEECYIKLDEDNLIVIDRKDDKILEKFSKIKFFSQLILMLGVITIACNLNI